MDEQHDLGEFDITPRPLHGDDPAPWWLWVFAVVLWLGVGYQIGWLVLHLLYWLR